MSVKVTCLVTMIIIFSDIFCLTTYNVFPEKKIAIKLLEVQIIYI